MLQAHILIQTLRIWGLEQFLQHKPLMGDLLTWWNHCENFDKQHSKYWNNQFYRKSCQRSFSDTFFPKHTGCVHKGKVILHCWIRCFEEQFTEHLNHAEPTEIAHKGFPLSWPHDVEVGALCRSTTILTVYSVSPFNQFRSVIRCFKSAREMKHLAGPGSVWNEPSVIWDKSPVLQLKL